jgi:hypothetical protein
VTIKHSTIAKLALTFVIAGVASVVKRVGEAKIDEHYAVPEITE